MKKYAFTFSVQQSFQQPILKHSFLVRCMPGTYPFQRSYAHKLTITPHAALTHISDVYGNEIFCEKSDFSAFCNFLMIQTYDTRRMSEISAILSAKSLYKSVGIFYNISDILGACRLFYFAETSRNCADTF